MIGSVYAAVTTWATDRCFRLREDVISTKPPCSVSILAAMGVAFNLLSSRAAQGRSPSVHNGC